MLGLAFDPNYASNGFFYIYRTVPGATAHNEVDRFHVSADPNVADAASLTSIISLDNLSATNHNGGWIGFGPDGALYIATGENAVPSNSQTLNNLLGKRKRKVFSVLIPLRRSDRPTAGRDRLCARIDDRSRTACVPRVIKYHWRPFDVKGGKLFGFPDLAHGHPPFVDCTMATSQTAWRRRFACATPTTI